MGGLLSRPPVDAMESPARWQASTGTEATNVGQARAMGVLFATLVDAMVPPAHWQGEYRDVLYQASRCIRFHLHGSDGIDGQPSYGQNFQDGDEPA